MMLLPWKKKLSGGSSADGRFYRLVADLRQQPSKRVRSPVVHSDFPASFIDILVKKTTKNKRKRGKQQRKQVPCDVASMETVQATQEAYHDFPQQAPNYSSSSSEEGEERYDSETAEPSEESDIPYLDAASRSRFLKRVVVAILGLLALFPKWLVIGATIAALSLSFAEFAGESFKPSDDKTVAIEDSGPVIEVSRSFERDSDHELDSGKSDSSRSEPDSEEIKVCEYNSKTAAVLEDSWASNAEEEDDNIVRESRLQRKLKSKIFKRVVPKKIRSHIKRAQ